MEGLKIHKGSVLLMNREVQVREWIDYLKDNLEDLTDGLTNATILILAGRHGKKDGTIGVVEFFKDEAGEVKNLLMRNHEGLVRLVNMYNSKYLSQHNLESFHLTDDTFYHFSGQKSEGGCKRDYSKKDDCN